jgi:hypothetical protein
VPHELRPVVWALLCGADEATEREAALCGAGAEGRGEMISSVGAGGTRRLCVVGGDRPCSAAAHHGTR